MALRMQTQDTPLHFFSQFAQVSGVSVPKHAASPIAVSEKLCSATTPSDLLAQEILRLHFGFIPNLENLESLEQEPPVVPSNTLHGYNTLPPTPLPSVKSPSSTFTTKCTRVPSPSPLNIKSDGSVIMAKKRRSLQSLFAPSFLQQYAASTSAVISQPSRTRSHTVSASISVKTPSILSLPDLPLLDLSAASRNSPPADLLDDDPFANLSPAPSLRSSSTPTSPVRSVFDVFSECDPPPPPRSPLSQSETLDPWPIHLVHDAPSFSSLHEAANRTSSQIVRTSGPPRIYRPAFATRPSLPSLNILARTSVHIPKHHPFALPILPYLGVFRIRGAVPDPHFDPYAYPDAFAHAHTRHTQLFTDDLLATLDYDYADAVSQLAMHPAASCCPGPYGSFESGSSVGTVRNITRPQFDASIDAIQRTLSDSAESKWSTEATESVLTLSPDPSTSSCSGPSSSSSCSRSRSSSSASSEYDFGDDEDFGEFSSAIGARRSDESHCSIGYGIPWPSSPPSVHTLSDSLCDDEAIEEIDIMQQRYSLALESSASDEAVDGGEGSSARRGTANGWSSSGGHGNRYTNGGANGWSSGSGGHDASSGSGRKVESDTSDSEEDDHDGGHDHDSQPEPRLRGGSHASPRSAAPAVEPADDDVPLARQIPTALRAQRTIRRQVRDEIDQRRAERTLRAQRSQEPQQDKPRQPERSARTVSGANPADAASHALPKPMGRPRTKTLPSSLGSPFSVGDLTKKLLGLQGPAAVSSPPVVPPTPGTRSKRTSLEPITKSPVSAIPLKLDPVPIRGRSQGEGDRRAPSSRQPSRPPTGTDSAASRERTLRPSRSFHRLHTTDTDALNAPPLPANAHPQSAYAAGFGLERAVTNGRRRIAEEPPPFHGYAPPPAPLDRARSMKAPSRRPSVDRRPEPESTSAGPQRARALKGQTMWQQRVFIITMQRFALVEIGSSTTAREVLHVVEGQGHLENGAGVGGWMLWEVSQDFGMERPIRNFELLSDVCSSWNNDKTVNMLVVKKTLLAPVLSRSAIPTSSPICHGYVQWEHKRGKWQKRWLELREHSLWLSKRDTGKDSTFLCSLSNFDAYYVTRVHKAPKPYVFSVKSTDSLTFFENTADYVHVFSCGESEGKNWLEKILLARSYVLYQERNVLSSNNAGNGTGAGPQRSGTRKQAPGQRPAQPLVNVSAPKSIYLCPLRSNLVLCLQNAGQHDVQSSICLL
ncbi:hypothetical protein A0H81_11185 [Grifola frondosa]|uniref:PH domain-containing protein n=1 Tax=Grifola frondosa TaxID=5627 RepID=A0A1C7M1B4_GRIFR|nr:hypothetical protein A0H81_11185 [Grifola frondosa]